MNTLVRLERRYRSDAGSRLPTPRRPPTAGEAGQSAGRARGDNASDRSPSLRRAGRPCTLRHAEPDRVQSD